MSKLTRDELEHFSSETLYWSREHARINELAHYRASRFRHDPKLKFAMVPLDEFDKNELIGILNYTFRLRRDGGEPIVDRE